MTVYHIYETRVLVGVDRRGANLRPLIRVEVQILGPYPCAVVIAELEQVWTLYSIIAQAEDKLAEQRKAIEYATFGGVLALSLEAIEGEYPAEIHSVVVSAAIEAIVDRPLGKSYKDAVLWCTWGLLRHKSVNRTEAAQIASLQLHGSLDYYTKEAWRKQVDRWASHNGLPKVEQYKRYSKLT